MRQQCFLVLAISDPVASLLGMRFGKRPLLKKTWLGSVGFFVATMSILLIWQVNYSPGVSAGLVLGCLASALVITVVELVSTNGTDNLTVPVTTALISSIFYSMI